MNSSGASPKQLMQGGDKGLMATGGGDDLPMEGVAALRTARMVGMPGCLYPTLSVR
jgi:hypothetical protein